MWSCNATTIEHETEKCESSVFRKERLVYPRLITLLRVSYTSFGIGWEATIQTVCMKYLRNRLVVWSTAILIYLPVLPFPIIIGSNVRFYAHDFHRADVGL